MTAVFIGGSRAITRLNPAITERVDNIIAHQFAVLIGDANGSDKAIQKYLADRKYGNVVVFCMEDGCRNNLGCWDTKVVASLNRRRDFSYFATKDAEMARAASYGFMLWDGKSRGTLHNIQNLVADGKKVLVYLSPRKAFYTLCHAVEIEPFLRAVDAPCVLPSPRQPDLFASRRESFAAESS